MVLVNFGGRRGGRAAQAARSDTTRTPDNGHRRGGAGAHTGRDVAASFSVLLLIMIGALAVRWLLSLPHGVTH
jgi:hypothetical protein